MKEAEANEQHKSIFGALRAAALKWEFELKNFVVGNRRSVVESDFYTKIKKLDEQEGNKDKLFSDHVTQVFSSRCKEVRGQPQRDRNRISSTICTCEEIERGTHTHSASKLGLVERWWTQDGKLRITIQEPPPRVRTTDTFIVFYLIVLHSVTYLKTCHFTACFTIL